MRATYVIVFVILLFSFVYSLYYCLTGGSTELCPLTLGLGGLLVIYTLAVGLLGQSDALEEIEVSPTRIKAVFKNLASRAKEVVREDTKTEVKEEVEEIKKRSRDPAMVYLDLIGRVERALYNVAESEGITGRRYVSMGSIVSELVKHEVIDKNLGDMIRDYWRVRNGIVHGNVKFDEQDLERIVEIGERIISELTRILDRKK